MAHEDLARKPDITPSSNRAFGLVIAGVLLLVAMRPLVSGLEPRWWIVGPASAVALIAVARPSWLARLNRFWVTLGLVLGAIASPIALGILFYGVFTPLSAAFRLTGKDPLRLKRDPAADTYWLPREPPGPAPDSLTNQF